MAIEDTEAKKRCLSPFRDSRSRAEQRRAPSWRDYRLLVSCNEAAADIRLGALRAKQPRVLIRWCSWYSSGFGARAGMQISVSWTSPASLCAQSPPASPLTRQTTKPPKPPQPFCFFTSPLPLLVRLHTLHTSSRSPTFPFLPCFSVHPPHPLERIHRVSSSRYLPFVTLRACSGLFLFGLLQYPAIVFIFFYSCIIQQLYLLWHCLNVIESVTL